MKIVLYRPQIPQNCGNIVRTCAVTGSSLCLVGPMGFSTSDRWLKRAGLDYWEGVIVEQTDSLDQVLEAATGNIHFLSSKASKSYSDVQYGPNDLLIFGSETEGLPEELHEKWGEHFRTIPMIPGQRCLNLATSVGIVVYEAWRQQNFAASKA
ncbi:MAG: tRNA (cytidine(34)-2'-O)-methyltransferase [Chlamydiales bacterium]|nr:tRNA (cytidine(34)-2'-O)-methyltransferase [Chlamydiales bacterium]